MNAFGKRVSGCAVRHNDRPVVVADRADHPKLRRVANPADISEAYREALWDGPIVDAVAELIGPDGKFSHRKLNLVRQYGSG